MVHGERCDIQQDGAWVACRVLVPLGQGTGNVLAVFRRLTDYKRVIWYRDGREVVVA